MVKNLRLIDFIKVYPNSLSDIECNEIIEEYSAPEWNKSKVIEKGISETRTSWNIHLSSPDVKQKNLEKRSQIDNKIYTIFAKNLASYIETFPRFTCNADTGYDLLRYKTGNQFKEHTDDPTRISVNTDGTIDRSSLVKRQISGIILLTDNYEGGELLFFGGTYKPKLKKGSCLLFPSNLMFPHKVSPVLKGTRYSIVTWFIET